MNLVQQIRTLGQQARQASWQLAQLTSAEKNQILQCIAEQLDQQRQAILAANQQDLSAAKQAALSPPLIERLTLSDERIDQMIAGLTQLQKLPDPVATQLAEYTHPNGMLIRKVRVPIGVIAMIYESRPNVTIDATGLCLKTANAVILRGGKEALHSNQALLAAIQAAAAHSPLPAHSVQLITTTERAAIKTLVQLTEHIDLVIPRGGEGLITSVTDWAKVPVIKHYKGLCHTYIDASANSDMAIAICVNAKCQRPGVCNALETILVHEAAAAQIIPPLVNALHTHGVECRGDQATMALSKQVIPATEDDWQLEYLDLIVAIKVVKSLPEAITHINTYGSHHSDAIISDDVKAQQQFCEQVDSAAVYINASTRFTDGSEFGMGAELGISTDKLHARGPMGLAELTTYKYVISGQGQTRD